MRLNNNNNNVMLITLLINWDGFVSSGFVRWLRLVSHGIILIIKVTS